MHHSYAPLQHTPRTVETGNLIANNRHSLDRTQKYDAGENALPDRGCVEKLLVDDVQRVALRGDEEHDEAAHKGVAEFEEERAPWRRRLRPAQHL